jgi:signal transduction histidine kinase
MAWRPTLRARLLAAYLVPTTLAMALIATFGYGIARRALEHSLGERLSSVAQGVAVGLRPDDALFLRPGDDESRTYKRVRARLEEHRDATGVRRVVLFDREGRALADSEGDYAIGARIPDLARDRLEVARCLEGAATASAVLFTGTDGRMYKTGYAPLRGEDGAVVAAVAVDGSAAYFAVLGDLGRSLVGLSFLGLFAIVAVSLFFSRSLTGPIRRLAEAARRIGEGDLETPVAAEQRGDELGQLAQSLEGMREELAARQRELQMMLGGIAHEVRNPLGGLELFTGLLAEELEGDEEKLAHVARLRKEHGHLARLVDEFLDYARERSLEKETVDAAALLEEIASLVGPDAEQAGVSVSVCAEAGLFVEADVGMVRRALLNLARNAVQATPADGVVRLFASRRDGEIAFSVEDTGPGVPDEMRTRIFEPFYTTREQGSGLGLALVAKAAEAHGGRVALGEAEGGGARFTVTLPGVGPERPET